ncbi:hypothetical protein FRC00_013578, partial [Tulasnella sp. 408]
RAEKAHAIDLYVSGEDLEGGEKEHRESLFETVAQPLTVEERKEWVFAGLICPASKDASEGSETEDDERVKEADSDSHKSVAEAIDEPVTFNSNVQLLDPIPEKCTFNDAWSTISRILHLLDVHNGNGFAMRRAPSDLRHGTGPLKHFLVRGDQLFIFGLVGRVSYTSFSDHKSSVTLNAIPILHANLQITNGLGLMTEFA